VCVDLDPRLLSVVVCAIIFFSVPTFLPSTARHLSPVIPNTPFMKQLGRKRKKNQRSFPSYHITSRSFPTISIHPSSQFLSKSPNSLCSVHPPSKFSTSTSIESNKYNQVKTESLVSTTCNQYIPPYAYPFR